MKECCDRPLLPTTDLRIAKYLRDPIVHTQKSPELQQRHVCTECLYETWLPIEEVVIKD